MRIVQAAHQGRTAIAGLAILPVLFAPALAQDMTAGVILDKMNSDQRTGFLAGVVEGLAYARFEREGNEEPGMKCIYRWFYEKEGTMENIHEAFNHFRDYMPGAVIAAMVQKECGA